MTDGASNGPQRPPADLLPAGLGAQVEAATGAELIGVKPRGGGGASREGAELSLRRADGREVRAYMNYDVKKAGAGDDAAFLREAAILRALSGPLAGAGVRTARLIASIPESRALIAEFAPGEADYNKLKSTEDRRAVAHDFMAQLATLHAIDAQAAHIEGMGEPGLPSEMIRERLGALRARNRANGEDPLLRLSLDWLETHIPPDPERVVIVHGDAGPANFLYQDGRVTALLDWELVHFGDPVADLAMLCLRNLFQPFIPLPEAFAAYEAAGGVRVDLGRVRYYRLFFQTGFAAGRRFADPKAPRPPNLGMNMVYSTIHRRVLSEALAEAAGVTLAPVAIPEVPPGPRDLSFEIALEDLREAIVPAISDQRASAKAKGLARLIKWWRTIDRLGPALQTEELAALSAALGRSFTNLEEGREALGRAVASGQIDTAAAIRLCNAQVARDAALMGDAMGALTKARFTPLD